MNKISIKFEHISKQYRLGTIGTGTLSHDLKRWWTVSIRRKADPYLKIGQENVLSGTRQGNQIARNDGFVWALKDISFDVQQGEVLGIIGRNGAGKSTLLKILSRVTTPTTGLIKANGRIASLLEVGTGFHPEMTGRENIFMNGSIMGMTKMEIKKKMDEIVHFSGIRAYIDTPVKRYSSGMTVRLGFAIAAHLEPEILVVDEVLAVGDAEFQKKAIGKMQDVSDKEGSTVLFVSHNMTAIRSLCSKCLLLDQGKSVIMGSIDEVLQNYSKIYNLNDDVWVFGGKKEQIYFKEISFGIESLTLKVNCTLVSNNNHKKSFIAVNIKGLTGEIIMQAVPQATPFIMPRNGEIRLEALIYLPKLIPGTYFCDLWVGSHFNETYDYVKSVFNFEINKSPTKDRTVPHSSEHGYIVPESKISNYD